MPVWAQITLAVVTAAIASSGFWAFLQHVTDKKDVRTRMLIGLGHDRIMYLGMKYIDRGYVTRSEYENLYKYLYLPYQQMGGNGSAKLVMEKVQKLELRGDVYES